jgi:acyl carrier protein
MYGPTETTVWSTTAIIEPSAEEVLLGAPIANTQIYLLDAHLQPVPIGVTGEIYIGGEGLAHGYLNQPELTAESFLPNPFVGTVPCACPGGRLYRTGDLARYHENGQLEYLGRRDQQVKLRGYRIELGEIEASLRTHPAIHEAVVVLREESEFAKTLVAYVMGRGEERPTRDDLYAHLRRQLPQYMVPTSVVFLETLPLLPNGKIDRKALPAPSVGVGLVPALHESAEMVLPQTPLQEQLALIWAELLHLSEVSIHRNFFELGGYSLLVAELMVRIQTAFGVKVPLRSLFEAPTIAEMTEIIERMQNEIIEQAESEIFDQMITTLEGLSDNQVHAMAISGQENIERRTK